MNSRKQVAPSRFLQRISESLDPDPDKLGRVAGQFLTPNGNREVYPVQMNSRTVFLTIPED